MLIHLKQDLNIQNKQDKGLFEKAFPELMGRMLEQKKAKESKVFCMVQ